MTDLSSELLQRLDKLAEVLGTTAEGLWTTLLRVGVVKGCVNTVLGLLMFVCLYFISKLIRSGLAYEKKTHYDDRGLIKLILGSIMGCAFFMLGLSYFFEGVVWVFAPEAYALSTLINLLGGCK